MYYLKKFCCVCMEGDRMLINTQNLNHNIMYFYYKYVIRDVNNASEKVPLYFCMRCFKTLKDFYNFTNHCVKTKNILEGYYAEMNEFNAFNDNLGDFNISVYLSDIDPYKQIQGTVVTGEKLEESIEIKQEVIDDDCNEIENEIRYETVETPAVEPEQTDINDLIRDGMINQVKIQRIEPKPLKVIRKKIKRNFRFSDVTPKGYRCKVCGNNYKGAKYLEIHMMIHTGERPYSCDICMKTFRQLPHLTQHRMIHFDLRPHQCHLCNKSFRQVAHLRSHILLHSNARNYKCDICQKTYRSGANLNSHRKSHFKMKRVIQNTQVQNAIV